MRMRLYGERRAASAAVLAFYMLLFLMNGAFGPPPFIPMFVSLGAAYGIAFFGVVAGWFWARWYTLGLAFTGVTMSVILAAQLGLDTIVLVYGGTHLVAGTMLLGEGMALSFDARPDWRERYHMDEGGANRLGKAVMRAGASLPYLIMMGLAPRQGMGAVFGFAAVVMAVSGLRGVIRMRTWGVVALAGSAVTALGAATYDTAALPLMSSWLPVVAVGLLAAAVLPFARPVARYLRG